MTTLFVPAPRAVDADVLEILAFFCVHLGRVFRRVVVVPDEMQRAVDRVEEQLFFGSPAVIFGAFGGDDRANAADRLSDRLKRAFYTMRTSDAIFERAELSVVRFRRLE